jgi:hypothetical protein
MNSKTVVEMPLSVLDDITEIKSTLASLIGREKKTTPNDILDAKWLTPAAFMKTIGVKRTWFERHKHQLDTRKIGRKVYVARAEVDRYFNGEIT